MTKSSWISSVSSVVTGDHPHLEVTLKVPPLSPPSPSSQNHCLKNISPLTTRVNAAVSPSNATAKILLEAELPSSAIVDALLTGAGFSVAVLPPDLLFRVKLQGTEKYPRLLYDGFLCRR